MALGTNEKLAASASSKDTPNYEVAFSVIDVKNKSDAQPYTTITIKPYLRHIKGVTRYRHHWDKIFYLDDSEVSRESWVLLPDSTASPTVVNAGRMFMNKNEWYQWGNTYTFSVPNDGKKHYIGLVMECHGTTPRYCPASNAPLYYEITTPNYNAVAPKPFDLKAIYNKTDKTVDFRWGVAPNAAGVTWQYVYVSYKMYDAYGTVVQEGNVSVDDRWELYNTDLGNVKLTIPENVVTLEWVVTNKSYNGNTNSTEGPTLTLDSTSKVWVNVPGIGWRKAVPWVNVPGLGWKKATKTYVNVPGLGWKSTKI